MQISSAFFLTIGLLLAACRPSPHQDIDFSTFRKHSLDTFMHEICKQYRIPGMTYVVIHGDSLHSNAVGIKNAKQDAMTIHTPINAGALSEPLLAYIVLALERSGNLNLTNKIIDYLPYFKMGGNGYRNITIEHLLTHTSGIDDYALFYDTPRSDSIALEITTRSIATQLPRWEMPYIEILRSAYNYDILADLLEKSIGKPFEGEMQERMFQPLGMLHSSFTKPDDVAQPFVTENYLDYRFVPSDSYPYTRAHSGSRGLHTSAHDMGRWMFHILHNDRFANRFLQVRYRSAKERGIGYGWDIVTDENGIDNYFKTTESGGFSNQMLVIPAKNIGVLIMSNMSGDFNPSKIANMVACWLDGRTALHLRIPIHIPMGIKLKETGRIEDALQIYDDCKEKQSKVYDFSEKSLLLLGQNVLKYENNAALAIDLFKFCTAMHPHSAMAYLNLAEAYLYDKQLDACRQQIAKANKAIGQAANSEHFVRYLEERMEILEEIK
ncbi:beta-lactamase family protein [Sphingobacterium sp. DN00404]|uniref:Beta-lactamase family protein n=1 Tax=Sphingobacterium micropteri TaxID=2763501 RepID=A0ABR7YL05_9SPHI|nr:serine hydrolase [Sphingobacterium micropteri]MBD1432003.1 beta-lactamase family protein [Sphingobacterium micropteri]